MRRNTCITVLLVAALGGCERAPESTAVDARAASQSAPPVNVQMTMLDTIIPQSSLFWEKSGNAQNDEGDVDPAKLDDANWTALHASAKALESAGSTLASATRHIAAAPGVALQNEGTQGAPTAADVQRYIDAKPDEFRSLAGKLRDTGAGMAAAIDARDGKALGQLSNALYEACEGCHVAFWYPEQRPSQ